MKKLATATASAVMVFGITGVGASLLSLTGSDSAPAGAKTEAACVTGDLTVTNPVIAGGENGNKIHYVTISGDAGAFTACEGQTMLVEAALSGSPSRAYGVYEITDGSVTSIKFGFSGETADSMFYNTAPTVSGTTLANAGTVISPVKAKDYGQTDVTIAQTWASS